MHANEAIERTADPAVDDFAAALTEAAYPVLLRRGGARDWLDSKLELWQALRETVRKWDQEWPRAGVVLAFPPAEPDGAGEGESFTEGFPCWSSVGGAANESSSRAAR
jgi:hypothetical protein